MAPVYTSVMGPVTDRLAIGDRVATSVRAGQPLATVADMNDISPAFARKAVWLATKYDTDTRDRLGPDVLRRLTVSHLEAAAGVPPEPRLELLRRAAAQGLSVRDVKDLVVRSHQPTAETFGMTGDLARACKAMEIYAEWPGEALNKLMNGPNGRLVRKLAASGRALANRLEAD